MSLLPSEIHAALTQLLQGLSSSDNNARSYAEEQLSAEWVAARPDVLLMGLVEQIQASQATQPSHPSAHVSVLKGMQASGNDSVSVLLIQRRYCCTACRQRRLTLAFVQTRSFAAVLFRRIATKTRKPPGSEESKELFLTLQQPQKIAIRQKLLECLQNETLPPVRHKIGDAVAEVARQYADDGRRQILKGTHRMRWCGLIWSNS